jgi:predicted esterase
MRRTSVAFRWTLFGLTVVAAWLAGVLSEAHLHLTRSPRSVESDAAHAPSPHARLRTTLGLPEQAPPWPQTTLLDRRVLVDHVAEQWQVADDPARGRHTLFRMVPVPEPAAAVPVVLCVHGHGEGADVLMGQRPGRQASSFALDVVRAGMIAVIPEFPSALDSSVEDVEAINVLARGSSLIAQRVQLLRRDLSLALQLAGADPHRVATIGFSMGAALAIYLAAVDTRVHAIYASGYFGHFSRTVLRSVQTLDNYPPGILTFGELPDIAGCIAPRRLTLELGDSDGLFLVDDARGAFRTLQQHYRRVGAEGQVTLAVAPGYHRFHGVELQTWLQELARQEGQALPPRRPPVDE